MQSSGWTTEHSEALREYLARRMSFSQIADAINAKFKTDYTRSATISRAKRMGLVSSNPLGVSQELARQRRKRRRRAKAPWTPRLPEQRKPPRERRRPLFMQPPRLKPVPMPKLRCVEIVPRHLSLIDLEAGDCRYPYGGDRDGEPINFCGHPQRPGSSYCTPHFHLTRGPGTFAERTADIVLLRWVKAASQIRAAGLAASRSVG